MQPRTADRFRAAVRREEYDEAERALEQLRLEVDALWPGASRAERQETAAQVTGLLEWARQTVLVSRSHVQAKLIGLSRQSAYVGSGSRRSGHLKLEA